MSLRDTSLGETLGETLAALLAAGAVGVLAWALLARGFSGLGAPTDSRPEIVEALEASRSDQRTLASLRPEDATEHRERFDELGRLLNRLRILELNRENLRRGVRNALLALIGVLLTLALGAHLIHQRALRQRLARLQEGLVELSRGAPDVSVADRRRDLVGRIARMIEDTSRRIGADRRRIEQLEHLEAWQEGARRIAHELKTPLAAAGLSLRALDDRTPADDAESRRAIDELDRELHRVADFVDRFASFARLPAPQTRATELGAFVERFADAHRDAWPGLSLSCGALEEGVAEIDPDLVRHVLANLCANAAQARGTEPVRVELRSSIAGAVFHLEVEDDGPGIPNRAKERIFTPYVTTRRAEGGLGLGLPICRKILLDHGGDLELVSSDRGSTRFRLVLPRVERTHGRAPALSDRSA